MKKNLLALLCVAQGFAQSQAAPVLPDDLELRTTINLSSDMGIAPSSMFNPRLFDGEIYVNQINIPGFGRYPSKSAVPNQLVFSTTEHRMVAPFRGDNKTVYMLGASGAATTTFTRYDFTGDNPVEAQLPGDGQTSEGFDWVDADTIVYTTYNPSANRKRISLATVEAEPFAVTPDTTWNVNGYVNTSVTTRIRNVRVGEVYNGYAYYGDSGQNSNPNFYAINLSTGEETLLGNAGTLTGSGSFGVWTVVERGGFLYVQTTDNGVQVYNMSNATTLGSLFTTYTKAQLDELTGNTGQFFGLNVSPDGQQIILGNASGLVYELAAIPPLKVVTTFNLATDSGITGNGVFNPRLFDGDVYVNQINTPVFGRYTLGSEVPEQVVYNEVEHRMVAPFRGENNEVYMLGASGATTTFFSRYDFTGENRVDAEVPGDGQTAEGYDWVDENTIIYTTYNPSANRRRISLAHVVAEPFAITPDTRWNANGFVATSATTRIRNVRVGDVYSGFAYYGDAGQNSDPKFYALNLATGAETLLEGAGTLTGTGSFGLWTVVERGGNLYVHTTDNGIRVYKMNSATALGAQIANFTKADLDNATGYAGQYWGFDVSQDGKTFILGGAPGLAWEVAVQVEEEEEELRLGISRSGNNVILSWPGSIEGVTLEAATELQPGAFTPINPQPTTAPNGADETATLPIGSGNMFFRLKK
ncbi:MAG: hypothetical protein ACO1QB_09660 [Verrucomicrobiales bacterium]